MRGDPSAPELQADTLTAGNCKGNYLYKKNKGNTYKYPDFVWPETQITSHY